MEEMPPLLSWPLPLRLLRLELSGFLAVLLISLIVEGALAYVSTRGTISDAKPRAITPYFIYIRTVLLFLNFLLCLVGMNWLTNHYLTYPSVAATKVLIGVVVWQLLSILTMCLVVWFVYDRVGRSWVRVSRYRNRSEDHPADKDHPHHKHSDVRNWRTRRLHMGYRDNWKRRCRILSCACCIGPGNRPSHEPDSFAEVANLLQEFFEDLDIVPTDMVAGLILLRRKQKRPGNDTYQFLSGVPICPQTKFLQLETEAAYVTLKRLRNYMNFALACYGWPFYLKENPKGDICKLMGTMICCGCSRPNTSVLSITGDSTEVLEDNCCFCHTAALKLTLPSPHVHIVHVNWHCGVGETPFFLAIDTLTREVILCIRGTLSIKDLITDLTAAPKPIPGHEPTWLAHMGIVRAAVHVHKHITADNLLEKAFMKMDEMPLSPHAPRSRLTIVGHSLGAGAATVLGLMLRNQYPDLKCFAFSPPGGLLSRPAAEATRDFVTTVVVGKDVVPRLGIAQMETLRSELGALLSSSKETKPTSVEPAEYGVEPLLDMASPSASPKDPQSNTDWSNRFSKSHAGTKLYLPGTIIHVLRTWGKDDEKKRKDGPQYTAIYDTHEAFGQVLVSPVMVQDHMPEGIITALDKIILRAESLQGTRSDALGLPLLASAGPAPEIRAPLASPETSLPPSELLTRKWGSSPGKLEQTLSLAPLGIIIEPIQHSPRVGIVANGNLLSPTAVADDIKFSIDAFSRSSINVYRNEEEEEETEQAWKDFIQTAEESNKADPLLNDAPPRSHDSPRAAVTFAGGKSVTPFPPQEIDPLLFRVRSDTLLSGVEGEPSGLLRRTGEKQDVRLESGDLNRMVRSPEIDNIARFSRGSANISDIVSEIASQDELSASGGSIES